MNLRGHRFESCRGARRGFAPRTPLRARSRRPGLPCAARVAEAHSLRSFAMSPPFRPPDFPRRFRFRQGHGGSRRSRSRPNSPRPRRRALAGTPRLRLTGDASGAEGLRHSVCSSLVVFTVTTRQVKSSCCSASPIQSRMVSASRVEISSAGAPTAARNTSFSLSSPNSSPAEFSASVTPSVNATSRSSGRKSMSAS